MNETDSKPKRILGVDYGTKKIGVAVSDKGQTFALPKIVLKNDNELMGKLEKIIKEDNISKVVIGESLNYKGDENLIMNDIKNFVTKINNKFNVLVVFEPEFLTTAQSKSVQGQTKMTDASAAALILQSFLDKKNI